MLSQVLEFTTRVYPRHHFVIYEDRYISGHKARYYRLVVDKKEFDFDFKDLGSAIIAMGIVEKLLPAANQEANDVTDERIQSVVDFSPVMANQLAEWIRRGMNSEVEL